VLAVDCHWGYGVFVMKEYVNFSLAFRSTVE